MERSKKDYYDILNVARNADEDEIKKAFKKLAMKYHPDKRGGDAEKFKEINEAYDVLSNPEKKQMYDKFGTTEMGDMDFASMAGGMNVENIFENLFGFGFHEQRKKKKSSPKVYQLEVSLEEVYEGRTIKFRMKKKIYKGDNSSKCSKCNGSGHITQQMSMGFMITQNIIACPECSGTGYHYKEKDFLNVEKEIDIPIPSGIKEGNHIVLRGQGDEYPNMDPGDVHFVIVYKEHAVFSVSKDDPLDLSTRLKINLLEALYGFKRVIRHLNGTLLEFYLPPRSSLCKIISEPIERKVVGEGLKFQGEIGDLYVYFEVQLPDPNTINLRASLETVFTIAESEDEEGCKKIVDVSI